MALLLGTTEAVFRVTETPFNAAGLLVDEDGWTTVAGFESIPGRENWSIGGGGPPQVRCICPGSDGADRLHGGVESAGVYASDDGDATWTTRRRRLHDVHQFVALEGDTFAAAGGGGLYRTPDAGRTRLRCDARVEHFQ